MIEQLHTLISPCWCLPAAPWGPGSHVDEDGTQQVFPAELTDEWFARTVEAYHARNSGHCREQNSYSIAIDLGYAGHDRRKVWDIRERYVRNLGSVGVQPPLPAAPVHTRTPCSAPDCDCDYVCEIRGVL
ncbi:hypothetical protein GCM10027258_62130 [Amycolatopsis stemonae]